MVFRLIIIGVAVLAVSGVGYFLMWIHDDDKFNEEEKDGKENKS